jgi:hypothetical protein
MLEYKRTASTPAGSNHGVLDDNRFLERKFPELLRPAFPTRGSYPICWLHDAMESKNYIRAHSSF